MAKRNVLSFFVLLFATLTFVMIFFSPFGPISSSLIPFHPVGWAGIFIYIAMLLRYSQKYENSKDEFWFVLAVIFFPLAISNLYFFPIPRLMGLGMFEWGGFQLAACFICFTIFGKNKFLRYTNLLMLILFPVFVAVFKMPQLGIPSTFQALPFIFLFVVAITLSYYSLQRKEYLLTIGILLNFLVTGLIVTLYVVAEILPFGWSQPLMAVVTDRIALFGGILMVLNLDAKGLRSMFD